MSGRERPAITPPNFAGIPAALRSIPQWVLWRLPWRDGRWTKVPFQTNGTAASSTDPATWATFEQVCAAYQRGRFDGIGFVVSAGSAIIGFDSDHCVDPQTGTLSRDQQALEAIAPTYWEPSPTGTGRRGFAIVRDWLPPKGGKHPAGAPFECYGENRFLTVTGGGTGDLEDLTDTFDKIHAVLMALCGKTLLAPRAGAPEPKRIQAPPFRLDDQALIQKMLSNPKNGAAIQRLWAGDTSAHAYTNPDGTPNAGRSNADQALANHLAFYCGGDAAQMWRLIQQSGLMRDKWNREDYRTDTIRNAIDGCSAFYSGHATPAPESAAAAVEVSLSVSSGTSGAPCLGAGPCEECPLGDSYEILRTAFAVVCKERDAFKQEVVELKEERATVRDVLRNKALGQGRLAALATAWEVDWQRKAGRPTHADGLFKLRNAETGAKVAMSDDTLAKHQDRFRELGLIQRKTLPDPESGWTSVYVDMPGQTVTEMLRPFATYQKPSPQDAGRTEDAPKTWGGKRVHCPHHPDADIRKRWYTHCAVCSRPLDSGETILSLDPQTGTVHEAKKPSPQDAGHRSVDPSITKTWDGAAPAATPDASPQDAGRGRLREMRLRIVRASYRLDSDPSATAGPLMGDCPGCKQYRYIPDGLDASEWLCMDCLTEPSGPCGQCGAEEWIRGDAGPYCRVCDAAYVPIAFVGAD